MCRFFAGLIFHCPMMREYDYYMRLDGGTSSFFEVGVVVVVVNTMITTYLDQPPCLSTPNRCRSFFVLHKFGHASGDSRIGEVTRDPFQLMHDRHLTYGFLKRESSLRQQRKFSGNFHALKSISMGGNGNSLASNPFPWEEWKLGVSSLFEPSNHQELHLGQFPRPKAMVCRHHTCPKHPSFKRVTRPNSG